MKKVHQSPEFQIIVQNQANAKFFVASFNTPGMTAVNPTQGLTPANPAGGTNYDQAASSYDRDGNTFNF